MTILDILDFQPMPIIDVFESMKASTSWYDKVHLRSGPGQNLYLSQTQARNSVANIVADQSLPSEPGNCITVTLKTQATFYQPAPFYTAQNFLLFRHPQLNQRNGPILVAIMRRAMQKFSWGYGVSMTRLSKTHVMVPVITGNGNAQAVDWGGLDRLGRELFDAATAGLQEVLQTGEEEDDTLPDLRFEPMLITDIFTEHRQSPAWLNTNQVVEGSPQHPHVTNTALGNSIARFIPPQSIAPNRGNAITIGIDTQVVAYQPAPFYGATKVFELRAPLLNAMNAPLLVTALRRAIAKFSWGHKASGARLLRTRIMVAVMKDDAGNIVVDWEGMAQYGRALRIRTERRVTPVIARIS